MRQRIFRSKHETVERLGTVRHCCCDVGRRWAPTWHPLLWPKKTCYAQLLRINANRPFLNKGTLSSFQQSRIEFVCPLGRGGKEVKRPCRTTFDRPINHFGSIASCRCGSFHLTHTGPLHNFLFTLVSVEEPVEAHGFLFILFFFFI